MTDTHSTTGVTSMSEGGVGLTHTQTAGVLKIPVGAVKVLVDRGVLTQLSKGEGRAVRYAVPLKDVLTLKAKMETGEFQVSSLKKKHKSGWKRPDLTGRKIGWIMLINKVNTIETKLDQLLASNGHTSS